MDSQLQISFHRSLSGKNGPSYLQIIRQVEHFRCWFHATYFLLPKHIGLSDQDRAGYLWNNNPACPYSDLFYLDQEAVKGHRDKTVFGT